MARFSPYGAAIGGIYALYGRQQGILKNRQYQEKLELERSARDLDRERLQMGYSELELRQKGLTEDQKRNAREAAMLDWQKEKFKEEVRLQEEGLKVERSKVDRLSAEDASEARLRDAKVETEKSRGKLNEARAGVIAAGGATSRATLVTEYGKAYRAALETKLSSYAKMFQPITPERLAQAQKEALAIASEQIGPQLELFNNVAAQSADYWSRIGVGQPKDESSASIADIAAEIDPNDEATIKAAMENVTKTHTELWEKMQQDETILDRLRGLALSENEEAAYSLNDPEGYAIYMRKKNEKKKLAFREKTQAIPSGPGVENYDTGKH